MKRHFLLNVILLLLSAFAMAQAPSIPVCDSYDANNVPQAVVNGTPTSLCTDYFGSPNWANSPLPAGTILSYTVLNGGSGYVNPTVVITDITGTTTNAIATVDTVNGNVISAVTGASITGYTMPLVTIVDTNCDGPGQPPCGSGAMVLANIGPPFVTGTGMLKFQDLLPSLAVAVPDTTTFPGSDYYVIGLQQYSTQMHANLPPTTLRGYCQLNDPKSLNVCNPSYLGPLIIAQKGRPVRVLFKNLLPTGLGGDLFVPMDPTYMGADAKNFSQNRATLHLHGGATPWISDGTPHQWTAPAGEALQGRGVSTAFVPDMWFLNGTLVSAGTAGATNDPGAGNMTFYWTNDQGGRLMFYHDHAYGITRLNVYAGEAAGYLLYDPAEEDALATAGAPGSITAGDTAHLIPLVIQDKTFVPSAAQINATDPTWGGAGTAFGASVLSTTANGNGDLWFPHVYMPNQNPNDPVTGAAAFGHWDYGAWFFPPLTSLSAANPPTAVTVPCASSAAGGQIWQCPIVPNPSGTPESFMDTPLVNGKAYPVLHVAPEAYRFQILGAGNDRSWNLSWFMADTSTTEVAMLAAAAPPLNGLPLCTAINPVAVPSLVLGLPTGLLDSTGNPMNGTGLPANCWPNYGPQAGIPAPQTMWAADGRAGGAPDPRTAGPAWVQIGTEGGLLPAPVVIPPTPVNYEQNPRSITIGSVAMHGLWLGPAERADVIVDFSKFTGKTLILYNDAPAPAPALDSRLDYFTGDGDQTPLGGAPNTQPGYGPNTRTIMQVIVDAPSPGNGKALNLPALKAAFASTATTQGLFAKTQPTTIVPEPGYNSAYNSIFPAKYMGIQDTTMTFSPIPAANVKFESLVSAENLPQCSATAPALCAGLNQKTIQELFTLDYGRMNATLGTELPLTNFQNQTTIPLGYVDSATEIVRQGDTQLWKITHNGVDTHFIHFHLFNVQVINRVGWDGSVRPPDANELGWKDTVRMNPLEDILVALQPLTPPTPWPLPNSIRLNDVTGSNMNFSNLNPFNNGGAVTQDGATNFGWEYVWHCHILGHEENDMMRPIIWQVPPRDPSNLTVADAANGGVDISFTDQSANETSFVVQRDINSAFPNPTSFNATASPTQNAAGEGTDYGSTITVNDPAAPSPGTTLYYRVQAVDDGFKAPFEQSYNVTGPVISNWVGPVTYVKGTATSTTVTAQPITYGQNGTVIVNVTATTGTLVPTGNVTLTVDGGGATTAALTNGSASFTINTPAVGSHILVATYAAQNNFQASTGTGTLDVSLASLTITASSGSMTYGGAVPAITPGYNGFVAGDNAGTALTTQPTCSTTATSTSPVASYPSTCSGAVAPNYTISYVAGTVTITPKAASVTPNAATKVVGAPDPVLTGTLSGFLAADGVTATYTRTPGETVGTYTISATLAPTGVLSNYAITNNTATFTITAAGPALGLSPLSLTFSSPLNVTSASQPVLVTNTGTGALIITSINFGGASPGRFGQTTNCPIRGAGLAAGVSCTVNVVFTPNSTTTRTATLRVNVSAPAVSGTVSLTGTTVLPAASVSPAAIPFNPQPINTTSTAQTVTFTNTGQVPVVISRIFLGGTNPGRFAITNNTCPIAGTGVAVGGSCTVDVTFTPRSRVSYSATLNFRDNATPGSQVVSLTGSGQ
jgi:FtsP/CotA-like multicopper oxidase with cupredoxin domain